MDVNGSKPIGRLEIHEQGKPTCERFIHLSKEILLGRGNGYTDVTFDDPTVSCYHLKIYSITYDQSDFNDIKPLVYAEDLSTNGSYWNDSLIGKGNSGVLLSDGDRIRLSPRITITFHALINYDDAGLGELQQNELEYFADKYRVTKRKLGAGGHGSVYMAITCSTGRQVACKVIDLRSIRREEDRKSTKFKMVRDKRCDGPSTERAMDVTFKDAKQRSVEQHTVKISREVEIMKGLCHPNIIRLERVYQSSNTLYIFQELVTGGDLFSYVQYKGGHLEEAQSAVLIRQVVQGLKHLHDLDIVHRDIKPENILVAALADAARIVITDFGSAFKYRPGENKARRMQTEIGTLEYVAPEVRGKNLFVTDKGYTKAVDMWSLGCTAIYLFNGTSYFLDRQASDDRRNTAEVSIEAATRCDLSRMETSPEWQGITGYQKDFVRKLLVLDERARMTAQQALEHRWFTQCQEVFEAAYDHATKYWQPHRIITDMIETIPSKSTIDHPTKLRLPKKPKQRAQKAIEPHYQPFHKHVNQIVSPVRPRTPLPTIAEVMEEWQQATSPQIESSRVPQLQSDLPNVEKLSIADLPSWETKDNERLPVLAARSLTHSRDAEWTGDGTNASWQSFVDDLSTRLPPYHEKLISGQSISRLFEHKSDPNDSPDELAMDLDDMPVTPSKRFLRLPLLSCSQTKMPTPRRKRRQMFDLEQDAVPETPRRLDPSHVLNAPFTPVNGRKSMKLNDFPSQSRRGADQSGRALGRESAGYDGPLISKTNLGNTTPKRPEKSKYPPFPAPETGESIIITQQSDKDEEYFDTVSTSLLTQTPSTRRQTSFDWEEEGLRIDAAKENRGFRSAKTYARDVERLRAQMEGKSPISGDLSDSIRTAYE